MDKIEKRIAGLTSTDLSGPLDEYLKTAGGTLNWWSVKPKNHESGRRLLELDRQQQVDLVLLGTLRLVESINRLHSRSAYSTRNRDLRNLMCLKPLLSAVLRKKLPFDEPKIVALVDILAGVKRMYVAETGIAGYFKQVDDFARERDVSERLCGSLETLMSTLKRSDDYAEARKAIARLEGLLDRNAAATSSSRGNAALERKGPDLDTGEAWTAALQAHLNQLSQPNRHVWYDLLDHAVGARTAKPSQKWLKEASWRLEPIGGEPFAAVMIDVLQSIGKPGKPKTAGTAGYAYQADPTQIHDRHADLLRGLVWCTSVVGADARLIQAVGDAAEACFKKVPGIGPRAPKIGNACLYALSNIDDMAAVAQLSRLKTRVKHASARKQLGKALQTAAENAGMSQDDLEEIAVPTCGMASVGQYRRPLGDYTALLTVSDMRKPPLVWIKPDGKTQKSVPSAVKEPFADEIKEVKRVAKEIEKLLPAQRDRIEQLYLRQRSHRFRDWRQRYLDHPLVGAISRRLIWKFRTGDRRAAGIWHADQIVDHSGQSLDWLANDTQVELWHPIGSDVDEVLAWRNWLEEHQVRQPFKQAHREIYVLTDAERRTETYSNRYAAHVLRQHQFAALCQQRGWRYTLQGAWDSHNTPFLDLPVQGMRAEFWVEAVGDYGADTSAAGIFLYATTDQVRFYRMNEDGPMRLEDVPPLVFSEVMRDIDLFVGVCSVGNDPNWADGGPEGRYLDYWQSYSFGDLSQSAQTRKEVLERIIPRLKIADQCSFSDRFLVVRGDIRSYKIHFGSGNILMSPNDQYLCIVPDRSQSARGQQGVFLPFEGDSLLSIILSKALLLADDRKIKDPSIVSQIRG